MTMFGRPLKTNTTALPDLDLKYDSERHMRRQTTAFEGAVKRSIKMAVIPQVSDAMAGAGATFTTQEAVVHSLCCMRPLAPSHRCTRERLKVPRDGRHFTGPRCDGGRGYNNNEARGRRHRCLCCMHPLCHNAAMFAGAAKGGLKMTSMLQVFLIIKKSP